MHTYADYFIHPMEDLGTTVFIFNGYIARTKNMGLFGRNISLFVAGI